MIPARKWQLGARLVDALIHWQPVASFIIATEHTWTPVDLACNTFAFRGAIYGLSSNCQCNTFLRPPSQAGGLRNLYFASGSTHPSGGIPLVTLSDKRVAQLINRQ